MKESYLAHCCLAQQDQLDTAARLGWHSSRVCHNCSRNMQVRVQDEKGQKRLGRCGPGSQHDDQHDEPAR